MAFFRSADGGTPRVPLVGGASLPAMRGLLARHAIEGRGPVAMTLSPRSLARPLASLALAGACVSIFVWTARADDPDALPLPRAKTPRVLKLPDDAEAAPAPEAGTLPRGGTNPLRQGAQPESNGPGAADGTAAKPSAGSDAELPRPAGKPGRAPEPDRAKADGEKKDAKKKDAKKEPPPPDGRCDECGSRDCVAKVCVPKLEEREITKVCWDAKCEDFCVPGPSVWCGTKCQKDDCGCWSHEIWKPTCAEVRTRVVPVRKTTKRKVPSVKWTVVERCACCRAKAPCGAAPAEDAAAKEKQAQGEKSRAPAGAAKGETPTEKPDSPKPGAANPDDAPAPKKTAARPAAEPGFTWPWAKWLR